MVGKRQRKSEEAKMVRNIGRGRGEEEAEGGLRAKETDLELDQEKGGP